MIVQTPRKNEIHFILDRETAKKLLSIFNEKSGVLLSEHPQIREINFLEAADDYIKTTGGKNKKIILSLSAETFEHGAWMIEYYLSHSCFNVAEFCEFELIEDQQSLSDSVINPKKRRMVQIFFCADSEFV